MSTPGAAGVHRRLALRSEGPARSDLVGGLVTWPAARPLRADVVPVLDRLGVRVAGSVASCGSGRSLGLHVR